MANTLQNSKRRIFVDTDTGGGQEEASCSIVPLYMNPAFPSA
ncbi:Uncharacterised protein [Bordetella pertussis]|nr:Uncharacterised protein [Bordetella pertussis]CPM34568.1 Uncharacterised protein [Bordetella pertussis]CPO95588.1 Uncharacterised protein [Bordetella pertussis]